MADLDNQVLRTRTIGRGDAAIDEGLRAYMLGVYNYMILGLATTGLAAYAIFRAAFTTVNTGFAVNSTYYLTDFGQTLFATPLVWAIMFSPLIFSLLLSYSITRINSRMALGLFFGFSLLMGLSLSMIFATYVATDIVRVFFLTAIAFGGLSLYGYTTKRDLSAMGTFLVMGIWGVIIASLLNFFVFKSTGFDLILSAVIVLVFAGVTAWKTQEIKEVYYHTGGQGEMAARASVIGAYSLYISFLNMFMALLRLLGNRQS